jgi:hypothetical protein
MTTTTTDHAARPDRTALLMDRLAAQGEPYDRDDPKHPHFTEMNY